MGGLLAARVLADFFERVTVIERDQLPDASPRRGVPQGRHLHGLLPRGRQALDGLFPGWWTSWSARAPRVARNMGSVRGEDK